MPCFMTIPRQGIQSQVHQFSIRCRHSRLEELRLSSTYDPKNDIVQSIVHKYDVGSVMDMTRGGGMCLN